MKNSREDHEPREQCDERVSQNNRTGTPRNGEIARQIGAIGHHAAHTHTNRKERLAHGGQEGCAADFAEIRREEPLKRLHETAREVVVDTEADQE